MSAQTQTRFHPAGSRSARPEVLHLPQVKLPFTAEERPSMTILFGKLTRKHERLIEGLLLGARYRAQLPETNRAAHERTMSERDKDREEQTMILGFIYLIHFIFGTISLYAGFIVLSRIFAGQYFERWTIIFLQSALATSVTGMLFSVREFQSSRLAAMVSVYAAGLAVLAWRWFHLTRAWGLTFAISLVGVLCLDVLAAVQHVFFWLSWLDAISQGTARLLFIITESAVSLFFATIGIIAVKRYWNKPSYRLYWHRSERPTQRP